MSLLSTMAAYDHVLRSLLIAEATFYISAVAMQSIKDMPVLQDGPPPGGFPSVRYARRLPSTGPTGFTLFAVTVGIMAYGFVKVSQASHGVMLAHCAAFKVSWECKYESPLAIKALHCTNTAGLELRQAGNTKLYEALHFAAGSQAKAIADTVSALIIYAGRRDKS